MPYRGRENHFVYRSKATHLLMGLVVLGLLPAPWGRAGPAMDRAEREHREAARRLEESQQEVFNRMNDYYDVAKSPDASPEKLEAARKAVGEAKGKVLGFFGGHGPIQQGGGGN